MISGRTRLICLLGDPVAHSNSPIIHNTGFELLGLDYVYLCFRTGIDELPETVSALRRLGARGFNCTMPVKTAVCDLLDELSPEAEMMHAVNCVVIDDDGRMKGYNTDGAGFIGAAREQGTDVTGADITILGGGGAATAIAVQSAFDGARSIRMAVRKGRSRDRAADITKKLSGRTGCRAEICDIEDESAMAAAIGASSILINATPVGMAPDTDATPVDISLLRPELTVADIIYEPHETRLLREARDTGCKAFSGDGMLLHQAAAAFRYWTGQELPFAAVQTQLKHRK